VSAGDILVIDDENIPLRYLALALGKTFPDHTILTASSGEEAMDLLSEPSRIDNGPVLTISDSGMETPLNGHALIKALHDTLPSTSPLIIYSGLGEAVSVCYEAIRKEDEAIGFVRDFKNVSAISKPQNFSALMPALKAILTENQALGVQEPSPTETLYVQPTTQDRLLEKCATEFQAASENFDDSNITGDELNAVFEIFDELDALESNKNQDRNTLKHEPAATVVAAFDGP